MMEHSQALRTTGYGVTFGTTYLEQGRYAEAVTSTGAEPELVDAAVGSATFTPSLIGSQPIDVLEAASPWGRRFSLDDLTPRGVKALAAALGGGLTLIDIDGDGDLDLFVASAQGQRLFRNDGRGVWTDVTAASGLGSASPDAVPIGCVAGDYDNDGRPDLFVLRYGGSSLYHNDGNGHFQGCDRCGRSSPVPVSAGRGRVCRRRPRRRSRSGHRRPCRSRRRACASRRPDADVSAATLSPARRSGCCATTATARSPTSRAPPASRRRLTRSPSSRPTSTTAATSICSWSTATGRRCCSRTCATARSATSRPTSALPRWSTGR